MNLNIKFHPQKKIKNCCKVFYLKTAKENNDLSDSFNKIFELK